MITEKPVPPSRRRRDVPAHIEAAVLTALQKNPDDRFPGAAALQAALGDGGPARRARPGIARTLALVLASVMLVAGSVYVATRRSVPASARTIAVLPFRTSGDAIFSNGLQDVISSALGRLPGLTVKAYSSDAHFHDPTIEFRAVGLALGVDEVLVGVLLSEADSVRLTVRLLDVRTGAQILTRIYTRSTANLFALQDDVSRDIADEIGLKLTGAQLAASRAGRTEDDTAHLLLVRARGYAQRRTPQAMETAVALYQDALARDSNYAEAWAGLAQAQNLRAVFRGGEPTPEFDSARSAITHALAVDSNSAEAHKALGVWHVMQDRNYDEAGREFARSLQLNPNDAETWLFRGWYLLATNHLDLAIQSMRHGQDVRSRSPRSLERGSLRCSGMPARTVLRKTSSTRC